jgi:hypothetical protein
MLLIAPRDSERPQRHFEPYPGPVSIPAGSARTFQLRAKGGRNPFRRAALPTLVVGDAGAAVRDADGRVLTGVPWSDAVAVLRRPDGGRLLLARDGFQINVQSEDWKDGTGAVALIDRFAPPDLVVRADA